MKAPPSPERWRIIEDLFHAAADLPADGRDAFLAEACAEDHGLRAEVEALLQRDATGGLIEGAIHEEAARAGDATADLAQPPHGRPGVHPPGTLLAGKYRLVELLGWGGMGDVHRAVNLEIDRPVAIKILTAYLAHDPEILARFRQEARVAARVRHPGIVDVFDLGEDADGAPFIVMELLEGETLRQRLRARGSLPAPEAVAIMSDVLAALGAVHAHRIVHRDLKPENVFLAAGPAPVTKILDFGISKLYGEGDPILTRTGATFGTTRYMAPEQLAGASDIGPAADLHAVGAILYELLAGRPPFEGATHAVVAAKILNESPPALTDVAPGVPRALAALTEALLAKDPAARPAPAESVRETLLAPDAQTSVRQLRAGLPAPPTTTEGRRLMIARAAALLRRPRVLLAAAAVGLALFVTVATTGHLPGRSPKRRSVAVVGFKNLSGRPDGAWLSTALGDLLAADLVAGNGLRAIAAQEVARTKIELGLTDADRYGPDTLQRIRRNVGSDYVVLGSYIDAETRADATLDLVVTLQDTATGEVVASVKDAGTKGDLFALVSRAGARLRGSLGLAQPSATDAEQVRASLPSDAAAARLYAEGLGRLRVYDLPAARARLQEAAGREESHPLIHSALSEVLRQLGEDARAAEEAQKAFSLARPLSREKRLLIEARYQEAVHAWDRAVEIYRALVAFFPDELEYGLALADAQRQGDRPTEAMATLAGLQRLPAAAGDPRIDRLESRTAYVTGDFQRARAAAAEAVRKADAQGAPLLAARSRFALSLACWRLGEAQRAKAEAAEAERVFARTGDEMQAAVTIAMMANILADEGDNTGAKAKHEQALVLFRKLGHRSSEANVLSNYSTILIDEGDLVGAQAMYEKLVATQRDLGDKRGLARTLHNFGHVRLQQGDVRAASALFDESLAVGRAIGEKNRVAAATAALAGVYVAEGDLERAQQQYEEARTLAAETGNREMTAEILLALGDCLLARGRVAEARRAAEQASGFSSGTRVLTLRLTEAILSARILAASGAPGSSQDATRALRASLDEAVRAGHAGKAFEARLALGEIEIASGSGDLGRRHLAELAREARVRGFGLIARRAVAASRQRRPAEGNRQASVGFTVVVFAAALPISC